MVKKLENVHVNSLSRGTDQAAACFETDGGRRPHAGGGRGHAAAPPLPRLGCFRPTADIRRANRDGSVRPKAGWQLWSERGRKPAVRSA